MINEEESLSNLSNSNIKDTFSPEIASDGHIQNISYHPPIKFNNIIQRFYYESVHNRFFNLKKMIIETALHRPDKGFYCFCPWSYPPRIIFVPRESHPYNKISFSDNFLNQWFGRS
jgi:hypothetical protein